MLKNIQVLSKFWQERQQVIRNEMIPYQWDVINDLKQVDIAVTNTGGDSSALDTNKSYVVENFLIAAGKKQGKRGGMVFQDSDAYKWLEAAAYTLECFPDAELQAKADRLVDIIADAQEEDGYLNTYFQVNEPDRKYQSLYMSHELYCAGHFIEAAVAYYGAVHNEKVLTVARKLADNIDAHFGPEEGKIHGGDGHEEIELALLRLYELTAEQRYLKLALYLLEIRGQDPEFFLKQQRRDLELGRKSLIQGLEIMHPDFTAAYFQSDCPVEKQQEARGHAVRVVYLCSALALGAALTGDHKLMQAVRTYWNNIVSRRMYLTGAIGSTAHGEAFTCDYDLPNDTIYGETCASVGLTFFAHNMRRGDQNGCYADVMEQALYNTVLAGMSLDGRGYFYVNPLEADPLLSQRNPGRFHVLTRRPGWFACACCPPNLARMVMSIGHYAYQQEGNTIYADLFLSSRAEFALAYDSKSHGEEAAADTVITQTTEYPWDATVRFKVDKAPETGITLAVRHPHWCQSFKLTINGTTVSAQDYEDRAGYIRIKQSLTAGVEVVFIFTMPLSLVEANPLVAADYDKVAVVRGPIVFCAEEVDNGPHLQYLHLDRRGLKGKFEPELLGGVYVVSAPGEKRINDFDDNAASLYRPLQQPHYQEVSVRLIPYYAWCNRSEGEMRVWFNRCSEHS